MIARTWHGITTAEKADEYVDYLNQTGVRDCEATIGNRGVFVLRRIEGEKAHFWFISLWESLEVIGNFAGDDIEKARYYPEDPAFLLELEPHVQHYEMVTQL